ncbi:hypothetical protein OWV82_010675 [Melia azedarach]|uniref:Uncharacterized protein n=1 Tax=Melia azedarach TaxID=155640 RepID=A0ACC1Y8Z6_MELAZ|nr:hypothetical protein OWV82_010675 [Melia azedarach]
MQIVYAGYEINPAEETIKAKAVFVDCAQVLEMSQTATSINIEFSIRVFMNIANTAFINARGHCYLYLTKESVYGGEHSRPQEQAQFYNECNYTDAGARFEEYNSPPMQNEEPQNVESNVPQPRDDATTTDEEEYGATRDISARGAYINSSTTIPSASNQYIRAMPPIPPSTDMSSDALSSSGSGDVSVEQIYNTKQELQDRLSIMAIKNHFQYKICKSDTTRFVAKCIENGCKW